MGDILLALACLAVAGCIIAILYPITKRNEEKAANRRIELLESLEKYHISSSKDYTYPNCHATRIYFTVDENNQMVYISIDGRDFVPIPFEKIIGYEILVDDCVSDAVGRSIVGGAIAGETGALIGAMTAKKMISSYKLIIYLDNIRSPQLILPLIRSRSDSVYVQEAINFASNIQAILKIIIHRNSRRF